MLPAKREFARKWRITQVPCLRTRAAYLVQSGNYTVAADMQYVQYLRKELPRVRVIARYPQYAKGV